MSARQALAAFCDDAFAAAVAKANADARLDLLIEAVDRGNVKAVKRLLASGVRADDYLLGDETLMAIAASGNQVAVLHALLDAGADRMRLFKDYSGHPFTVVGAAVDEDAVDTLRFLLQEGMSLEVPKGGRPLLFRAVDADATRCLDVLVAAGLDLNTLTSDEHGFTPLMLAVVHDNVALVKHLLELGAKKDLVDGDGYTAADYATNFDDPRLIAALSETARSVPAVR